MSLYTDCVNYKLSLINGFKEYTEAQKTLLRQRAQEQCRTHENVIEALTAKCIEEQARYWYDTHQPWGGFASESEYQAFLDAWEHERQTTISQACVASVALRMEQSSTPVGALQNPVVLALVLLGGYYAYKHFVK